METAIRLENVTKRYGDFALENINLEIPKGCIVGLVGENGAGKTTMIKAIMGLIHPQEGTVYINDKPLDALEEEWKEDLGAVLAGLYFFTEGTADMLGNCMRDIYKNWDDTVYQEYLEKFKIPPKKKISDYSKGMKVKLNIAVAFSHHAKLLLLDEPTSGLDPVIRDEILDILLDFIQDEENTVLMSSHIISDMERTADYIAFLRDGKLQFMESREKLLEEYGLVRCRKEELDMLPEAYIKGVRKSAFDCELLIKGKQQFVREFPHLVVNEARVEDIIVYSVRGVKEVQI